MITVINLIVIRHFVHLNDL